VVIRIVEEVRVEEVDMAEGDMEEVDMEEVRFLSCASIFSWPFVKDTSSNATFFISALFS
jgi:hypothetical protein